MNLKILGHDFIERDGELFCSDMSTIRAEDVSLDWSSGEMMARHKGMELEVNLCSGCYETVILHLVGEIERLMNKKCPHDLAQEFLEGDD